MGLLEYPLEADVAEDLGAVLHDADPLPWSEAATWDSGSVPQHGHVVIPAGRNVLLDIDLDIQSLVVQGALVVAERDTRLRANRILVSGDGALRAGRVDRPFTHQLTITLCGDAEPLDPTGLGSKFLAAVSGGTIDLHGEPRVSWAMLGPSARPGSETLQLAQAVDWRVGERIAIASGGSDLPLVEDRTVTEVHRDQRTVTLDAPLQHRHLGKHGHIVNPLPSTIGKVALLSRNIVIEGCEGSLANGFGAHCVIAGRPPGEVAGPAPRRAIGRFSNVEFRRLGQFNRVGRYPIHWHDNGDAVESALTGSIIHQCFQRGVVMSGTRHVRLADNVVLRPFGHGYIVEHPDDTPQLVASNLAIRPRGARFADLAMRSFCEHRPSAFWIARNGTQRSI